VLNVWTDGSITGGAWGKKSEAPSLPHAWSAWYALDEAGRLVHHHSVDLGENPTFSGNVAEYFAVRSALHWLQKEYRHHVLKIHSDSQLIVNQLSGNFNVHNERLKLFRDACWHLAKKFPRVSYEWIRREKNTVADQLSKCLQQQYGARPLTSSEVEALLAAQ
jgi:ribonuclease HI